jgi:uncharacterized protein YegP (UPF0339 family)
MKNVLRVYPDRSGKIRWTILAAETGDILADSGQGYANEEDAMNGFFRVSMMGTSDFEVHRFPTREAVEDIEYSIETWAALNPLTVRPHIT